MRRHRWTAAARSRRSASRSVHATWSGVGVSATVAGPNGSRSDRRYVVPSHASSPGTCRVRRKSSSGPPSNGARNGSRSSIAPPPPGAAALVLAMVVARALARDRSWLGVRANTDRTVSLNCRMLANPLANATCDIGRSVVSIRMRAVWARWARASAIGPAPTSVTSCRWTWRSL